MKTMKKILIVCSLLLAVLVFVPGVLADTATGTAPISGNPAQSISLTVTGSQSFGDMTTGIQNVNTSAQNSVVVNVSTNAPWAITVNDALDGSKPAGTVGRMAEYGSGIYTPSGKSLTDPLNVGPDGVTYYALSGSQSTALWTGDAVTQNNFPWFRQMIENTDTRTGFGHSYRIVVTFTATGT